MVPLPRNMEGRTFLGGDNDENENEGFEFEMVSGSMELRDQYNSDLKEDRRKSIMIAISAALTGTAAFFFSKDQNGVGGIALLHAMEKDSAPLAEVVCNGRPTVVDFYADYCQSCKVMAPTMREMEIRYKDKLNFVTLDGTKQANADLVEKFKVDGIPQIAFITPRNSGAEVLTNLVGAIPRRIIMDELDALLATNDKTVKGEELPYLGFELKNPYPLKELIDNNSCPIAVNTANSNGIMKN